jgi:site-specific DNA-cytosine methylase
MTQSLTRETITYGTIVPLVGGEVIGTMKAMNDRLPEWVLSYTPFAGNDSHFVNYLRDVKKWDKEYVLLDAPGNENYVPTKQVDVVMTTCPCAGLSSLSTTSNADSNVNEWMYTTTEYVLGSIKPKVFWGENAPRLFTTAGKKVADKLQEIGKKYGYVLNLYYTESRLHGLAQKRPRTFYFFTKGEENPVFKYYRRDTEPVEDILKMEMRADDLMNVLINEEKPMLNPWIAYCVHKSGASNILEYYNTLEKSTNCIVQSDRISGSLHEVADWMDENNFKTKFGERARAMQGKVDSGKGYWAHGVTVPKGIIPSLVGALPYSLVNPFKDQYLTLRDCLRIMKMPEDFNLIGERPVTSSNVICQNVPVTTAADMMENVIEYLTGNTDTIKTDLLKQSNASMTYTTADDDKVSNTMALDEFFSLQKLNSVL